MHAEPAAAAPSPPPKASGVLRSLWARMSGTANWLGTADSRGADLARALLLYSVTRAALAVFVWLTGQHYVCHGRRCVDNAFFPDNSLLNGLFQWDAHHYLSIVTKGYFVGGGYDTNATFFPGFPLAAWLFGKLFGGSTMAGGIVVNHLASILAAFLVARLVRHLRIGGTGAALSNTAREATLFWLASPLTIFFAVFLSESLFSLCSVAVLWAVVTGSWPVLLVAGVWATLTRNTGVILIGAAALLAWERRREQPVGWKIWTCLAIAPVGLLAFMAHQYHVLGDAFAWVHLQERWGRRLMFPWQSIARDWTGWPSLRGHNVDAMYHVQELFAWLAVAPLLFLRKKLGIPWSLWLLGVAMWLTTICSGWSASLARHQSANIYFAIAIPALIANRPLLRGVIWVLFGMVLAWYASTYPFGNWAS